MPPFPSLTLSSRAQLSHRVHGPRLPVPASPWPSPPQLGSGAWLDRQCPPPGLSPRPCSQPSPGPLFSLITGAQACVLAPAPPWGQGSSPQGPQGGVLTTSHLPDPGSDAPMGGSWQDEGGVLGRGPGQARGPALSLAGPQALAPSAQLIDGQLRLTWATANCLPTRKGGRRARYLTRSTTHCVRTLCARSAPGSVAQLWGCGCRPGVAGTPRSRL